MILMVLLGFILGISSLLLFVAIVHKAQLDALEDALIEDVGLGREAEKAAEMRRRAAYND